MIKFDKLHANFLRQICDGMIVIKIIDTKNIPA